MKEILQLFRRDAEHAIPVGRDAAKYGDLGTKPRILKDSSTSLASGNGSASGSASVVSSRQGTVSREGTATPPYSSRPETAARKEDAIFGRRW